MVRKAVMDDFPVILNIYATARAFMAKTGNPTQWADGHPSADLLRETIRLMHRSQKAAGYPMPLTA